MQFDRKLRTEVFGESAVYMKCPAAPLLCCGQRLIDHAIQPMGVQRAVKTVRIACLQRGKQTIADVLISRMQTGQVHFPDFESAVSGALHEVVGKQRCLAKFQPILWLLRIGIGCREAPLRTGLVCQRQLRLQFYALMLASGQRLRQQGNGQTDVLAHPLLLII